MASEALVGVETMVLLPQGVRTVIRPQGCLMATRDPYEWSWDTDYDLFLFLFFTKIFFNPEVEGRNYR